jgi:thiamine-phosphate pyrophosphorylase
VSKSCHSIEELENIDDYDYIFLSPIFFFFSKKGYRSNFSDEVLTAASLNGKINQKVIALGGINHDTLPLLKKYAFGGVAVLGCIWETENVVTNFQHLKSKIVNLKSLAFQFQFITHCTDRYNYYQSAEMALLGGCKWIQLRMKGKSVDEIKQVALQLKPLCKSHNAVFLLNDHVELCKEIEADGVHLGKTDMNPQQAREVLGKNAIIGCTCNSFEDIENLKNSPIDYIGLGPFRFTATKENLSAVLGLEKYKDIVNECHTNNIHLPIVAIGGITADDVLPLLQTGVKGIAVSSAILQAENPVEETKKFCIFAP